jgi:hypothetical protein
MSLSGRLVPLPSSCPVLIIGKRERKKFTELVLPWRSASVSVSGLISDASESAAADRESSSKGSAAAGKEHPKSTFYSSVDLHFFFLIPDVAPLSLQISSKLMFAHIPLLCCI